MSREASARSAKFRQAAFFYLLVAVLYLSVVWILHEDGSVPARGPIGVYMAAGVAIAAGVFAGLWRWENVWVARLVCILGAFRIPALLRGAFLPAEGASLSETLYLVALVVVLINLWLLARAGWDL